MRNSWQINEDFKLRHATVDLELACSPMFPQPFIPICDPCYLKTTTKATWATTKNNDDTKRMISRKGDNQDGNAGGNGASLLCLPLKY
jgi:hypothetical protein